MFIAFWTFRLWAINYNNSKAEGVFNFDETMERDVNFVLFGTTVTKLNKKTQFQIL